MFGERAETRSMGLNISLKLQDSSLILKPPSQTSQLFFRHSKLLSLDIDPKISAYESHFIVMVGRGHKIAISLMNYIKLSFINIYQSANFVPVK